MRHADLHEDVHGRQRAGGRGVVRRLACAAWACGFEAMAAAAAIQRR